MTFTSNFVTFYMAYEKDALTTVCMHRNRCLLTTDPVAAVAALGAALLRQVDVELALAMVPVPDYGASRLLLELFCCALRETCLTANLEVLLDSGAGSPLWRFWACRNLASADAVWDGKPASACRQVWAGAGRCYSATRTCSLLHFTQGSIRPWPCQMADAAFPVCLALLCLLSRPSSHAYCP